HFRVSEYKGTPVVAVSGDVDLSNAHELSAILDETANGGPLAIDLTQLFFIDSTGLNAIARCGRTQIDQGDELFLIVDRAPVRKIFEIVAFDQQFNVLTSLDDLP
ncbi:MAG TPA: STAS domain-containing protein, partial [Candidatus Aquilonibacter sp.]|nr:STAS domain-containing protein [Candidatus Aquilonibacter sp.]